MLEQRPAMAQLARTPDLNKTESAVVSEKPTEVAARSIGQLTDDHFLASAKMIATREMSHLIARMKLSYLIRFLTEISFAKDGVIGSDKPEANEGKFEKTVPGEAKTKSSDVEMASKSFEIKDNKVINKHEPRSSEEMFDLKDERFVLDPNRITMLTKVTSNEQSM